MKKLTLIVGAGGTGSYLIPNILRQYNDSFLDNKVIVLDGDFLEERNLLRQGFFKSVINNTKANAMYKMHGKNYFGFFECKSDFLNHADEIVNIVAEQTITYDQVVLISCVDNHMARLRLLLAQQMLKVAYPNMEVLFADSGNEEWFGQTILSYMSSEDKAFIDFKNNEFKLIEENIPETVDSVFSYVGSDWQNNLTRGDHELSCDIVVESAPQNIATNMMASNVLLYSINRLFNENRVDNIYFDCKLNISNIKNKNEKEVLVRFYKELIDYLNSDEVTNVISELFLNNNKDSDTIFIRKPIVFTTETVKESVLVINFDELKGKIRNNIKDVPTRQIFPPQKNTDVIDLEIEEQSKKNPSFLDSLELELSDVKPKKHNNLNSIISELDLDI